MLLETDFAASQGAGAGTSFADSGRKQLSSGPIDRQHLGRFTLGDASLEFEVLGLFAAQTPLTIAALKDASSDKDWKMAAHTLKGSARAVGAWRLAELALQAESLGGIRDHAAVTKIIDMMEDAASEVASFISGLEQGQAR